jgi:hypothetical protein
MLAADLDRCHMDKLLRSLEVCASPLRTGPAHAKGSSLDQFAE